MCVNPPVRKFTHVDTWMAYRAGGMATKPRHRKTPIQLWVADNRKAGGYASADLAAWTGVTTDTARGWESRGRPSEDALSILERRFGKQAPRDEDVPSDQSAVARQIDRLVDATNAQTRMLAAVLEAIVARLPLADPDVRAAVDALADAERQHARDRAGTTSPPPRSAPPSGEERTPGSRTGGRA